MVVNIKYSQLSNRLALLAHVLASAVVGRRDLLITVFEDLKDRYVCACPKDISVRMRASRFWAIEKRLYGVARRVIGDRLAERISRQMGVVSFWRYRDREAIRCARDEVRAFFAPKEAYVAYARWFEAAHFAAGQVRIGLHVRRGDYRTWKGGCYWYADEVYRDVVRRLVQEMEASGRYRGKARLVVIFSDDRTVKAETFAGARYGVIRSEGSAMDDHELMSKCDLLVGPPSTFTLWASWYGKVPMCHIQNAQHRPRLEEFKWNENC